MYEPYDPVVGLVYLIAYLGILGGVLIIFIAVLRAWFNHLKHHIITYYTAVTDDALLPVRAILPLSVLTDRPYDLDRVIVDGGSQVYRFVSNSHVTIYYRHTITFLWVWFFHKRKHLFRTSQLRYTHPEYFI